MPTNNLATNLLVTGVISQLASYPHPLLRSVLLHPDLILQPSIRGLFTAIASLRYVIHGYELLLKHEPFYMKQIYFLYIIMLIH